MGSVFHAAGKRLERGRRGTPRKTRKGRAAEARLHLKGWARAWISWIFAPFSRVSRSRRSAPSRSIGALIKRQALVVLFRATASAFRCEMPRLWGLPREQCLAAYARFTTLWAEQALRSGRDLADTRQRLYRNAYQLGRMVGWPFRIRGVAGVMTAGRFLYGILDIDFQGSGSGEITIGRCYFSSFYSPDVCRLMSSMDRGLLAGLAGGGELAFTERITERQECCRARFTFDREE